MPIAPMSSARLARTPAALGFSWEGVSMGKRWSDLESEQPHLAEVGRRRLAAPGVVLVGTIRRDGSPRISPVEPLLWKGELWLSMGLGSLKARDLRHDPRILVHSIVTSRDGRDGEYKVRGWAVAEPDRNVQAAFAHEAAARLGWEPEVGKFHLFRVAIGDVTFVHWDDATNDQFVTRWPQGVEFVRRGTSATSQGPPEPLTDLLVTPSSRP
jgi:hypothetical protein